MHINVVGYVTQSSFIRGSWLFVDFFFVLSGFVIAKVYLDRIDGRTSFVVFVVRRFGRLWPLHAFVLLLFVITESVKAFGAATGLPTHVPAFGDAYPIAALGPNLLLIHSLGLYDTFTWNVPSWTISVEFYTYLVFASLCVASRRQIVAATAIGAGISVAALLLWSPGYLKTSLDFGIFRCLYGFLVGVLVLLAFHAFSRRSRNLPSATGLEVATLALSVGFVVTAGSSTAPTMLAPIVFAATIFVFAFEEGPLSRLLSARAFTWLGDRSYTIYMTHAFVIYLINRALVLGGEVTSTDLVRRMEFAETLSNTAYTGNRLAADLLIVPYVVAMLAVAHIVFVTVEQPGRAFFNRLATAIAERGYAAPSATP